MEITGAQGSTASDEADRARSGQPEQGPAAWFAAVREARLPFASTSVARILRDHSGLSLEDIAELTGLHVRGARKALRRLEAAGFLSTRLGGGRAPGGGGRRNVYTRTIPGRAP